MLPSGEFNDPRLAAAYDTLNGYAAGTQPDFYVGLARDLDARTVVEIGCGTGLVTARLVRAGFAVVGLDPAGPMLEIARRRPEARGARWIHGPVTALDAHDVDLAVMAGHVAQFFLTDDAWRRALTTVQHYRFTAAQEELTARTALRFRTVEEIEESLRAAGFAVEHRYGGWDRRPFTAGDEEVVTVAVSR